MAITFDTFLNELLEHQEKLTNFYKVDKKSSRIFFHFPTFYSIWIEECHNHKHPIKRRDLVANVKTQPYFVDSQTLSRLHGKPARCTVLDYGSRPSAELLAFVYNAAAFKPSAKTCSCDISVLIARGCQCGGI